MRIDPARIPPKDAYHLMTSIVVPRPIAWVSTLGEDGVANLAPFSFFGGVTSDPPTVMLSVGRRKGAQKDTARNLLARREAVVHIPTMRHAEAMVATAAEVGPEVSEFELAGLERVRGDRVVADRILDADVAMEVRLSQHQEVGRGPVDLFLLEVVLVHLAERVLDGRRVRGADLRAVGRLGGSEYCDSSAVFAIARPGARPAADGARGGPVAEVRARLGRVARRLRAAVR